MRPRRPFRIGARWTRLEAEANSVPQFSAGSTKVDSSVTKAPVTRRAALWSQSYGVPSPVQRTWVRWHGHRKPIRVTRLGFHRERRDRWSIFSGRDMHPRATNMQLQACEARQRFRCPTFMRQSFVEWAAQTIPRSYWAGAFYAQQRHAVARIKPLYAPSRSSGSASSLAAGKTGLSVTSPAPPSLPASALRSNFYDSVLTVHLRA
jgi:hypothetical protein